MLELNTWIRGASLVQNVVQNGELKVLDCAAWHLKEDDEVSDESFICGYW